MKRISVLLLGFMFSFLLVMNDVYASDNESVEYITITVDAADDNEYLEYAIDTDDPTAFGTSNVFRVEAGIPHTVYVRDAAGNITSQTYEPVDVEINDADENEYPGMSENHEKNLIPDTTGVETDTNDYNSYTNIEDQPAEGGAGTMYEKVVTDGSEDSRRVFYTVTTKEGEVFYIVIDQNRGEDNVYLLDAVTVDDLQALCDENGYNMEMRERNDNGESSSSEKETIEDVVNEKEEEDTGKKKNSNKNTILIIVLAAIGGGAFYYLKIYRKKKDALMDEIDNAHDLNEFVPEDNEDEVDMPEDPDDMVMSDDEWKKEYDEQEEQSYYDMDPDDDMESSDPDMEGDDEA